MSVIERQARYRDALGRGMLALIGAVILVAAGLTMCALIIF